MSHGSNEVDDLVKQAVAGDSQSWEALLERYGPRIRRMVGFRLDARLQGRVDPSDVVQDIWVEAWQHLMTYASQSETSFFLWLRALAGHTLVDLHRHHLGAQMRDVRREVALDHRLGQDGTSQALAAQLLGHETQPSEAALRAERKLRLQAALGAMDPLDREVLALRHFEQLSAIETAQVLGIREKAAGMRYIRALRRLKEILSELGGWSR